jgi:hypothetical protein
VAASTYKVDTDAIALKGEAGVRGQGQDQEKGQARSQDQESGLVPIKSKGGESAALRFLSSFKIAQGEPALVSPCTHIPL